MVVPCNGMIVATTLIIISAARPAGALIHPGGTGPSIFNGARSLSPARCRPNRSVTRVSAARPQGSVPTPIKPGRVTVRVNPIETPTTAADEKKRSKRTKEAFLESSEDERQTARWGVPPLKVPFENPLSAPISVVSKTFEAVGKGVTGVKDALYGVADGASSLVEVTQQSVNKVTGKSRKTVIEDSETRTPTAVVPSSTAGQRALDGGNTLSGVFAVLRVLRTGAVAVKDAFWGSIEVLGDAADAVMKAPDVARSGMEDGKAALEGAKRNVEAVALAPARAAEAVSKAVDGAGRAASILKDGTYGTLDAVAQLASAPAEFAERRRIEQQERQEKATQDAKRRKEAVQNIGSAVTGAKSAVWGTVEGVETVVAAVASAPAAIEAGFVRAQEAARSAAVVLENIPRTVQEIPLEAQRKVDGVKASVAAIQASLDSVLSGVKGGVTGASNVATRAAAVATGRERKERMERERREKEEARMKKMKEAIITIQGEPYTAKDLALKAATILGETAKVAVVLGKGAVSFASAAKDAPAEITRAVLGPVYNYQQSRRRVREALAKESPPPQPISARFFESSGSTVESSFLPPARPMVDPASSSSAPAPPPSPPSAADPSTVVSSSATGSSPDTPKISAGKASWRDAVTEGRAAGTRGGSGGGISGGRSGGGVGSGSMNGEGVFDILNAEGVASSAEEFEKEAGKYGKQKGGPPGGWSKTGFTK